MPASDTPQTLNFSEHHLRGVFLELGRCVAVYQGIERSLKLLLPHMRSTSKMPKTNEALNWRAFAASRKTLGELVELLQKRADADDPAELRRSLQLLGKQRNEVVHRLFEQSFAQLRTQDEIQQALAFFETRREFARMWMESLQQLLLQFQDVLASQQDCNASSEA